MSARGSILVDSSVWIDFFASRPGRAGNELRRLIADAEPVVLAGVIVTEVLQGLSRHADRVAHYLAQWDVLEPEGFATYMREAEIYRSARSHGLTLTTTDVLIAALAIEHGATLFSLDKDFARLAELVSLRLYEAR